MRAFLGILLLSVIFSSCEWSVRGSFENKTNDTVRVICFHTNDVPPVDFHESSVEWRYSTGGRFLSVNEIKIISVIFN